MVVWGGGTPNGPVNTGALYDPVANKWTATSTAGAPTGPLFHTAVWTGGTMIVWGGNNNVLPAVFNTGGRYDPATDAWSPTTTVGAPVPRSQHAAAWTGSQMVVFGGRDGSAFYNDGSRYTP
jgi:N-acetylneuraminic acid mutarotase